MIFRAKKHLSMIPYGMSILSISRYNEEGWVMRFYWKPFNQSYLLIMSIEECVLRKKTYNTLLYPISMLRGGWISSNFSDSTRFSVDSYWDKRIKFENILWVKVSRIQSIPPKSKQNSKQLWWEDSNTSTL